jgi:hypothetical protein
VAWSRHELQLLDISRTLGWGGLSVCLAVTISAAAHGRILTAAGTVTLIGGAVVACTLVRGLDHATKEATRALVIGLGCAVACLAADDRSPLFECRCRASRSTGLDRHLRRGGT